MRVLFIIQGEGRGHLTQAISMWQLLKRHNYTVISCLVGISSDHKNSFLEGQIDAPIQYFKSPNLAYSATGKGLSIKKTLSQNIIGFRTFLSSISFLKQKINALEPDLIINFYDLLAGITKFLNPSIKCPMVCIAHQYLMLHKDFKYPKGKIYDRFLVNLNTRITALGSQKKLALSFSPLEKTADITSVAPLLREELSLEEVNSQSFLLAYLTHESLLPELIKSHKLQSNQEIHCFVKRECVVEVEEIEKNLFIHKPHSKKFLSMMASCKGLITTAGFEAVSEAIYLGKPIMMIPVPNHYEQSCNALDASLFGAGIWGNKFEIKLFLEYLKTHKCQTERFNQWLKKGTDIIIQELELVVLGYKKETKGVYNVTDAVLLLGISFY